MIDITSILDPHCVSVAIEARSRKRALEVASDMLAAKHPELSARNVFDELMNRERLGSTGLGEGVAIPHCRLSCSQITGAFLTLENAVDYEAMDDQPVDLLFVFIVPHAETGAHLDLLAALARLFGEPENRNRLRTLHCDAAAYEQFVGMFSSQAA
jgi:PTS system nitrogen regulatory IIA component